MKKFHYITSLFFVLFVFSSCQKKFATFQHSSLSVNKTKTISHTPPEVTITNPLESENLVASIDNRIESTTIFEDIEKDSDFTFDEAKIKKELKSISKVESIITESPITNLDEIKRIELEEGITIEKSNSTFTTIKDETPLKIPPFVWGCCLSIVGVAIIYFTTDEDKELTKKALWGCLAGGVGCVGIWLLYSLLGGGYYY